jgi:hypothetical protein
MKICLTFDYELYFGRPSGTVTNCLLTPTQLIREATEPFGIPTVQFVDAFYLLKLKEEMIRFPRLKEDYEKVTTQLKEMAMAGHDLQLHVHPHWKDSHYDGKEWIINAARYRLHAFNDEEIIKILKDCKAEIQQLNPTGKVNAYRAGGWCLQPFNRLKKAFIENNIEIDSSVFPGGRYESQHYYYDFRNSPESASWRFEDDPLVPVQNGRFTEIAITSLRNSPLFYWKLFLLGRLFPQYHKPIGDGRAIAVPGQRRTLLTQHTLQTVSLDGYNAALLEKALENQIRKGEEYLVIIGHPKALTRFGADALKKFVRKHHKEHTFITFAQYAI